jgi:hypothetical protein
LFPLKEIMHNKFFLKYKRMNTTSAKYFEATYAEKRL